MPSHHPIRALLAVGLALLFGCATVAEAPGEREPALPAPLPTPSEPSPSGELLPELPTRLAALIERLGAPEFADREAATRELAAIGGAAHEALAAAAASPDLEIASRSGALLRAMDALERITVWEQSLRVELAWLGITERTLENAVLQVSADDLPDLGKGGHFYGQTLVEVDGFLKFMGEISDSHSNVQNAGVMDWYRGIRKGTVRIHYRYTFFRSYSVGPNWTDRFTDWEVLHSGVRTITVTKGS